MLIRPVHDADELERAYDLAGSALLDEPSDHHDWRFAAVRDAFPADRDVDFVAVERDEIVGALLCFRDDGGVRARILGVRRDHQGEGVGKALMEALLAAAWSAGEKRVHLGSVPTAVGFYEACGLTVSEVLHDGATTVLEAINPAHTHA